MERIERIDVLRGLAILGVILIHTISRSFSFYAPASKSWHLLLVVDQISRFSVPLFVGVSGYILAVRYKDRIINLRQFYLRRIGRLVPLYLFWTAAIYYYLHFINVEPALSFPLWKIIFLGKADYHLYFVPMIFSLYLLFPLLLALVKKSPEKMLIGAFALQVAIYWLMLGIVWSDIRVNFVWGDQQQYLFFGTWIFYFILGIYLGLKNVVIDRRKTIIFLLLATFGVTLAIFDSLRIVNSHRDLLLATSFTRLSVLFYASVMIVIGLSLKILDFKNVIFRVFDLVGKRSYSIYLTHTIALRFFFEYVRPATIGNFFLLFAVVTLTSGVVAEFSERAFDIILRRRDRH